MLAFSLPEAGSTLMVTFLGEGVLVASTPSGMAGTVVTVLVLISWYARSGIGRFVDELVMDWRPPCIGHADDRGLVTTLFTPGAAAPLVLFISLQKWSALGTGPPVKRQGWTYGGETDVAGVNVLLAPAGDW